MFGAVVSCRIDPNRGVGIISCPPMYFFKTSGISIVPSGFWKFSRIATIARSVATSVLFSVCRYFVGSLGFSRYRIFDLTAW